MPFTRQFIEELHKAFGPYVIEAVESESGIAGRILDDNVETGINYKEILTATSLDELKKKAEKIALQNKVYCDFRSGHCYEDDETKRQKLGCPRIYAQMSGDKAALEAFPCYGVSYIPSCPKFKTSICWRKFDELGLKME
ncbi:hypothetical protein AALD01_04555 [Oscillospiraceae bacterium 21-37]